MHPKLRLAFESQREQLLGAVPANLLLHRDMMHETHMPLPIVLSG